MLDSEMEKALAPGVVEKGIKGPVKLSGLWGMSRIQRTDANDSHLSLALVENVIRLRFKTDFLTGILCIPKFCALREVL